MSARKPVPTLRFPHVRHISGYCRECGLRWPCPRAEDEPELDRMPDGSRPWDHWSGGVE